MSFLTRTQPLRLLALAPRTALPTATRAFSASALQAKGPVGAAKDVLHKVDRKVSDKLVGGIEIGETVAEKAKRLAHLEAAEAEAKADELAGQVKGKAGEAAGKAKGKTDELTGSLKGKAKEVKGAAKGKADDIDTTGFESL